MKSLITKRQLLFVILVLLCGINPIYADTSKELYVSPGNLSSLLPEGERFEITDLTLSGRLDISDLEVIRQMGRCYNFDRPGSRYNGHLRYLDLSNAEFVGDGTFRSYIGNSTYTWSHLNYGSGNYLFSDMKSLHTIKLPNSLEIMGGYLFDGCDSLTSVTLPKSLKPLDNWTLVYRFEQNDNLTSILIDDSNPYYSSDGSALFDKFKTEMLFAVNSLREYAIPSSVSEISEGAFYNCRHLKTLVLPLRLKEGEVANRFIDCDNLYSISVDEKNPYLCSDGSVLYNKNKSKLFFVCHTVRKMSIPSSVKVIGSYAFYKCTDLTSIELPSGVTWIGYNAFNGCTNLSSLTLPSGVKEIWLSTFEGCESLRSITLPSNVKEIGSHAFKGCKGLTSIYAFMEKPCKIEETTFDNETIINATLYVPNGSLLDYWDDNQWKKFMNIEEFDATSIGSLNTNANDIQEVSRYSDNGQRLNTPAKGLNIVKYNNGTVKKIMVK